MWLPLTLPPLAQAAPANGMPGWAVALVALGGVSGVVGALSAFLNARSDRKLKEQAAALDEYRDFCAVQKAEIDRLIAQGDRQQAVIWRLFRSSAARGEIIRDLYGYLREFHGHARRLTAQLKAQGVGVEDVPDLPPPPDLRDEEDEHLARAAQADTDLLRDLSTKAKPPGSDEKAVKPS